jgi:hypothetical protein
MHPFRRGRHANMQRSMPEQPALAKEKATSPMEKAA